MGSGQIEDGSPGARARDWRNARHAAVCDLIEPWAHGTVARAGRFPSYYDFNVLRVERGSSLTVGELAAAADQALAGLWHRRVDFDLVEDGDARRTEFEAAGWQATRLVWMRHELPLPEAPAGPLVEAVDYEATEDLRLSWHLEDFPDYEYADYQRGAKELALAGGARTFAVTEAGSAIAFAQVQFAGAGAEINSVYVHPDSRGNGLGTSVTRAAVKAAEGVSDLWIVADEEERAKDLYARLGFRTVWTTIEFLRLLP